MPMGARRWTECGMNVDKIVLLDRVKVGFNLDCSESVGRVGKERKGKVWVGFLATWVQT